MSTATRTQRRYDHRLRQLVQSTGRIDIALDSGVPRSTAYGWLTRSHSDIVTIDVLENTVTELQREVIQLRCRNARLIALMRLVITVMKVAGFSLTCVRLPEKASKRRVLRTIEQARTHFTLRTVLRVIGLTHGRFHAWTKDECGLDDIDSCPKSSPQQLTTTELATIREMATSDGFRHVPTGTLALLAQRLGKVFASASTWYRLIRIHMWRRPRQRVHPAKPKVGIRAQQANEIWHVDTTLVRLLDGRKAYLHAVIDNYSRRILSWRVQESFVPAVKAELLVEAAEGVSHRKPELLVDGGVENYNDAVDKLVETGLLKRLLAQTEITFSNSLIESWWRVLKHQWLFLNTLDTAASVRKLVAFYVDQHNSHLPHSAFKGQTPDEMYFGSTNTYRSNWKRLAWPLDSHALKRTEL